MADERLGQLTPLQRASLLVEKMQARIDRLEAERVEPIAVVGIGCRYPGGANDADSFWELVRAGVDAIGPVPPDRWDGPALRDPNPLAPGKMVSDQGGFLPGIALFDRRFFGISPRPSPSCMARFSTASIASTPASSASPGARRSAWIRSTGWCSRSAGKRSSMPAMRRDR